MKILCRIANGIRMTFDWFMSMFDSLFNEHKFVRRSIVFWSMVVITWSILHGLPRLKDGHLLSALTVIIGILATAIGFYQWLRNKDGD